MAGYREEHRCAKECIREEHHRDTGDLSAPTFMERQQHSVGMDRDYSAAVFASALNAESVTIWKDVPGVMNADPKRISGAIAFEELPFKEAAEMTYYGASVIHPKTIKPLANKGIPLYVKNFDDPSLHGTKIHECAVRNLPPLIVFKENHVFDLM
ncbi:MAG: hypothetical protein WDO15_23360 [Bacteroidota bacterium]